MMKNNPIRPAPTCAWGGCHKPREHPSTRLCYEHSVQKTYVVAAAGRHIFA